MTIVNPSAITALPPVPIKGQAGFSAAADAFVGALQPFGEQVNAVGAAAYSNALDAKSSAENAIAAAATSNAEKWVDNKNYIVGEAVISPAALLNNAVNAVYICKVDTGGVHIDPYLDSTRWTVYSISPNSGGAIYTTSTTLNSTSPFSIQISGGAGVWIKLPDATTIVKGLRHAVRNVGDNDVTLIDAVGAHIGFIRPQCGTIIALSDNSTAAGKWAGDWEQIGITADFQILSTTAGAANVKQIIQLDAVRTMVIVGGSAGQNLAAAVYDTTTQTAGTPVVIRAAAWGAMAVKSAADQVLCVAFDSGNPGNLYATVLTVSGTSVTVNTAVTAAITGQFSGVCNWVAVGGAWCFSYNNTSYGVARAITISGTVPSIGAEQSAAASGAPRLYASGSVLRAVRVSSASTIVCTPYTVSGNTLTAGTLASTATTLSDAAVRTLQYQNGDILALHTNDGYYVSSIFRLSTTTEAVNSANIRSHGTLWTSNISTGCYDYSIIDATKIAFMCSVNPGFDTNSINNVVNNSGTPVAATAADFTSGSQYVNEIKSSISGECGFALNSGADLMYFDCSGTSPVRTRVLRISARFSGPAISGSNRSKSTTGVYPSQILINSKSIYSVSAFNINSYITPIYSIDSSGVKIPCKITPMLRIDPSIRGENNQTTWAVTPLTTAAEGNLGVALQRIEVAQI